MKKRDRGSRRSPANAITTSAAYVVTTSIQGTDCSTVAGVFESGDDAVRHAHRAVDPQGQPGMTGAEARERHQDAIEALRKGGSYRVGEHSDLSAEVTLHAVIGRGCGDGHRAGTDTAQAEGRERKSYTLACAFAEYVGATVTVEAGTLEEAFEEALEKAGETGSWKRTDTSGPTFIAAYAEGPDADPWSGEALPVPGRFTESGEPPLIVVTGPGPAGGIDVAEGRARIQYVREAGTFIADLSGGERVHHGQPVVEIVRRLDGAPEVTVAGGPVRVRYYEEDKVWPH